MHGLTESEIREVVVDVRALPLNFRLSNKYDAILQSWNGWEVEWKTGRASWGPNSIEHSLDVEWYAVEGAVRRLRARQEREADRALAAPSPSSPDKPPPEPKAPVDPPPPPIPPPPKKPRLRYAELLRWWVNEYLPQYDNPDRRPSRKAQRNDAADRFPHHARPTEASMKLLRADKATPGEWKEAGRPPEEIE